MRQLNKHLSFACNILCLSKHVQLFGPDTKNMSVATYCARLQWIKENHPKKEALLTPFKDLGEVETAGIKVLAMDK